MGTCGRISNERPIFGIEGDERVQFTKILSVLLVGWFVVVVGASPAWADIINVTDWRLVTYARDTMGPSVEAIDTTVTLPFAEVHTATDGPTTAQSAYDFAMYEHSASFDFLFDYNRSVSDSSAISTGSIDFVSTQTINYTVAGWFALSGTGRISMSAGIRNLSGYGGEVVYREDHESQFTPDESFTLGVSGGDVSSVEIGDLSGSLIAGTPYRLTYSYLIENYPFASDSAATAEGKLTFTLTPEPGTLILLAIGGLAFMRQQR